MTYKVQVTSVKPAGTPWFSEVSRENRQIVGRHNEWLKTQKTGLLNFSKTFPNPNTVVRVFEFDTKENFDAYMAASKGHPDGVLKEAYNQANNIVTTRTVL